MAARAPRAGIAAGHPATASAGIEILAEGGTAADAAVAATLVSCVAETVMTGIAGGGHALWWDAAGGAARLLDCFVAVPGLGARRVPAPTIELAIPFGSQPVPYAIGIATCAVPGVPVGLEELWLRYGRLPWSRLCRPAVRAAADGVAIPDAHATCLEMLESVMTLREGAAIYAPAGRLLGPGDRLHQPGLARTMEVLANEGASTFSTGTIARELLSLMDERGGLVTAEDLRAYRPSWLEPVACGYAGRAVFTRRDLAGVAETLERLPPLCALSPAAHALALAEALDLSDTAGHTTSLTVVDADANACVVTTSLGLGSGDFLPGFDIHLNSMLGETELLVRPLDAGERMPSMMAPTAAVGRDGLELAAGSAGGSRLRSALVQVLSGILDDGLPPQEAVDRPRLHPAGGLVHLEPGFDPSVSETLEERGYAVQIWPERHHFFGGANVVGRAGAGADPRRSGLALLLDDVT